MIRAPRVAVTRAVGDETTLVAALTRLGLDVAVTPLLRFEYLDDDALVTRLAATDADRRYAWVVCTSRHAVAALARAWARGGGTAAISGARFAAVGESTAQALRSLGAPPALVPAIADAHHLAESLLACGAAGRVLFPRAREARAELPELLRAHGVEVDDVVCYDTIAAPEGARELAMELLDRRLGVVTLASGSAARAFATHVPHEARVHAQLVSIGPTTTAAAASCGLSIASEATEASVDALALAAQRLVHDSLSHA